MPFMLYLLQLPSALLFVLVVSIALIIGVSATYLGRRFIKFKMLPAHNEFVGLTFSVVAGLYGLVLAFVIFLVWDQLDQAQKTADLEGSHALELYQDIRYYTDKAKSDEMNVAFLKYVDLVVHKEYPLMSVNKKSAETDISFDKISDIIGKLRITNRGSQQKSIDNFSHNLMTNNILKDLNEVTTYRNLRLLSGEAAIPPEIWIALLLGGLITLVFAVILNIGNFKLHLVVNGLLGVFLGIVLYLIILIDHPYSGELSIKPNSYQQILDKNKPNQYH